jgi:hypothetical protein
MVELEFEEGLLSEKELGEIQLNRKNVIKIVLVKPGV